MSTRWREVRVYLRSVFLVATVAACGQSNGCAGCDPDGPAFPDKDKIHSAVQVRLSAPGVQFLEENVEPLLSQAIPEGLSLCIPGDGGDLVVVQWGYCNSEPCSDGQLGCEVNVGIGAVDLEPIPGPPLADGTPTERAATLRATVTFDELNARFDVRASPVVDCAIRLDAPGFPVSVVRSHPLPHLLAAEPPVPAGGSEHPPAGQRRLPQPAVRSDRWGAEPALHR